MPLWAKVDVDMPTDGKLFGQPVATRHLWTCLVCLAKKQDDHGAIRGYDCALLAGSFNIPRRAVAAALTHFQAARMIELDPDGTIRLLNFTKRQGEVTIEEQRGMWRDRQEKRRERVTRDNADVSPVTALDVTRGSHASRVEVEVEEKKKQHSAKSPAAPLLASLSELSEGWPPELLERVRVALVSTRASGEMSDGRWRSFLGKAKQFTPAIRVRAADEYLDRAFAADGKDEKYLVGIMRGERSRAKAQTNAGHLQISPEIATETTGRKVI